VAADDGDFISFAELGAAIIIRSWPRTDVHVVSRDKRDVGKSNGGGRIGIAERTCFGRSRNRLGRENVRETCDTDENENEEFDASFHFLLSEMAFLKVLPNLQTTLHISKVASVRMLVNFFISAKSPASHLVRRNLRHQKRPEKRLFSINLTDSA